MASRTENLARMKRRVLDVLPASVKEQMLQANNKSANEFMDLVRKIIPVGDPQDGNLIDSLKKKSSDRDETAVLVTIGGKETGHGYVAHLEFGHKAADGSHVPPKPFWYPAKRVLAKRHRNRSKRVLSKALKVASNG